jgi:hypothetical protein
MHWTVVVSVFYCCALLAAGSPISAAPERVRVERVQRWRSVVPPNKLVKEYVMSAYPQQGKKVSLMKRFSRRAVRLRDPEWQSLWKAFAGREGHRRRWVLLFITLVSG